MRFRLLSFAILVLAVPAAAAPLKLVEHFQSQGCSSCPPANAALNAIADRPDLIALNYAVTYRDQLGWPDKFASDGRHPLATLIAELTSVAGWAIGVTRLGYMGMQRNPLRLPNQNACERQSV